MSHQTQIVGSANQRFPVGLPTDPLVAQMSHFAVHIIDSLDDFVLKEKGFLLFLVVGSGYTLPTTADCDVVSHEFTKKMPAMSQYSTDHAAV